MADCKWRPLGCAPRNGKWFLAIAGKQQRVVNWPPGHAIGEWYKQGKGDWVGSAVSWFLPTLWRELPDGPKKKNRTKQKPLKASDIVGTY